MPEKRLYGNTDDAFIEKRRVELEGFLRVLVAMDKRIQDDMIINAFLTLEESKYAEFMENPHPYLDKMWTVYNSLPKMPTKRDIHEISQNGVTGTVKNVLKRLNHEISGVIEPDIL